MSFSLLLIMVLWVTLRFLAGWNLVKIFFEMLKVFYCCRGDIFYPPYISSLYGACLFLSADYNDKGPDDSLYKLSITIETNLYNIF